MSKVITRRIGVLQRVAASDFSVAEEVLKTAELLIVPEDQTQRQAFEKLMPHLYVLRNKGCSWSQLAKLLGECGFKLQPSTVRSYFSEMLASRMDVCQARMNEQIALMAAIRSETAGVDISAVSGRVNAFMARQQTSAAPKVDALFGPATADPKPKALNAPAPQAPQPAQHARPVRSQVQEPAKAADSHIVEADSPPEGEFGLLGLSRPSQQSQSGPAGFFTLDTEPPPPAPPAAAPERQRERRQAHAPTPAPAPVVSQRTPAEVAHATEASAPTQGVARKRTSPLQEGVPPLKRRDSVPAHVYEPGELEHPAIPGLMLGLEQRLYGASLEYFDQDGDEAGVIKVETPDEKRFRVVWRQTVPITPTRTAASFTRMDPSLFSPQS